MLDNEALLSVLLEEKRKEISQLLLSAAPNGQQKVTWGFVCKTWQQKSLKRDLCSVNSTKINEDIEWDTTFKYN